MGRTAHGVERALRIYDENSQTGFIDIVSGAGAPLGTSGKTDEAPVGSLYSNRTNGGVWKKTADTSSASDWTELGDVTIDELNWRNEKVRFATDDTLSAGTFDITTLSDNDDMVIGDINVGEYCIGDLDGSPALFEVTAKPGGDQITIAAAGQAIASNDTFVVQQYLPDATGQENQAIVHIPVAGAPGIKISDVDWNLADGINLNGYTESQGPVTSADTVQTAIEKTGGDVSDLVTLSGVARGSTVLGAFASPATFLLGAALTIKSALQTIGDFLSQLRGVSVSGITTATTVDEVVVDDVQACKWLVEAFEEATPANKQAFEIYALNDSTASGDAANVDDTVFSKLKLGSNFDLTISVDLNGTGAAQTMRLRAASGTAGVTVRARRISVRAS